MQITKVVNLKISPFDMYIGRAMPNRPASIWENPYEIGRDGTRAEVIAKYATYVRARTDLMDQLPQLRGLTLGCWCKPNSCHGDVLVELIEGPNSTEPVQGSLF
ncbi:MAG: DUF4326 domain-containing protein [Agitococcus sp.]|nr:DUF4326 domain-containing protein [Agitococcus sp.]MDO9177077.1 DUF4326 domain-containing protein [Agitococcus sp.]